jgi:uncharacterized membrane protein
MTAISPKKIRASSYRRMHVPTCLETAVVPTPPPTGDYQKQTEFLRHCLLYEDTLESRRLAEKMTEVQNDDRSVHRAFRLMVLLGTISLVGLCYSMIFLTDYPTNMMRFMGRFMTQFFCVLGLVAAICLPAFAILGFVYRKKLDQQREACRLLAMRIMESRLGKPVIPPG